MAMWKGYLLLAVCFLVVMSIFLLGGFRKSTSFPLPALPIAATTTTKQMISEACVLPPTGFRSWKEGVVTVVRPKQQRNCKELFSGNKFQISRVQLQLKRWKNLVSDTQVLVKSRDCSWVRGYFTDNLYTTKLERSFPIAFTYVVYNSPQQILRLLRFHYRQDNVYCIHPDKESPRTFSNIFRNIAACLDNVVIPKELINVVWGTESIMDAQMTCLKELVKFREHQTENEKWRYVLNLCGKELPLTTTHEIVEHLIRLNGSSSIKSSLMSSNWPAYKRLLGKTIPFGLPGYKSMTYLALSYTFTNFLLTNETAIKLYNFFRGCRQPEEHYYPTVYNIPGVPGGYDPKLESAYFEIDNYFWMYDKKARKCGGIKVHHICIVSVAELKDIVRASGDGKRALFHNKYFMEVDHVVMDCMEEKLVARNRKEFENDCNKSAGISAK